MKLYLLVIATSLVIAVTSQLTHNSHENGTDGKGIVRIIKRATIRRNLTQTAPEGRAKLDLLRRDTNNTTSGGSTKLSNATLTPENGYQQGPASWETIPNIGFRAEQNVSNATKTISEGRLKRALVLRDTNNTTSEGSTKLSNANKTSWDGYKWERTRRDTNTNTSGGSTQLSYASKTYGGWNTYQLTRRDTIPDVRSTKLSKATKTESNVRAKPELLQRNTKEIAFWGGIKRNIGIKRTPSDGGNKRELLRRDTNQTTSGGGTKRNIVIDRTPSDGGNKRKLARRDINQTAPVELRAKDKRQIVEKAETTPNPGPTDLPDFGDDSFNTFSYTERQV